MKLNQQTVALKKSLRWDLQVGYLHPAADIQDEANMLLTLNPRK